MKIFLLCLALVLSIFSGNAQEFERYHSIPDTLFQSKNLRYARKISLTLPNTLQKNLGQQNFPLIVIFDSQNQRSFQYILRTIDYLTSTEQMPESIIIGVESTVENRYKETQLSISDSACHGANNEAFIFDELIPFAQENFSASDFVMLIGHSRYGYFTSYLLTEHYKELNAVISASPFFSQKNVNLIDSIGKLATNFPGDRALYYRFGIGNDFPEDFKKMDAMLQSKSQNKHANFKGRYDPEADHNATPGLLISTALYEVFEYWSLQQNAYINNENKDPKSYHNLSEKIANHYGLPIKFSLGVLNGKGWYFYNEGEYHVAIEVWERLMTEYPNFSEGYLYQIYAKQELGESYDEIMKKLSKSMSTTTFYTPSGLLELEQEIKNLDQK